jgi:hypothetical protein
MAGAPCAVTANGPSPKNNFFATVRARPVRQRQNALVSSKGFAGPAWFLSCVVEFRKHLHPSEKGPIWVGQRMALALDAWVASVRLRNIEKSSNLFAASWYD